ncbi:B-cell receptor CD22-like [Symphorus nematophorus]
MTCTLRITDLRESDSSEYKFTFKTKQARKFTRLPGVTLSVTDPDLQVQVRRSYLTRAELFCYSACHLPERPSYIWYKNGQKVQEETFSSYSDYFDPADSYSCAWQSPSQPEDLSEDSQYAGRVQVPETERGRRSTLRITDLTERDSAEYHFKFTAGRFEWNSILPATTLTVTALQVQVTKVTVHQFHTEAELKCHSSCSPAAHFSYVWFKNGQKVMGKETSSYTDDFHPGDNISCAFKGHEDYCSPSLYAPQVPSVSVHPSGEILEGSSVTLTCSSDANIAAKYTWYKKTMNLKPLINEAELVFSSIQSSDSGEYYCTAENELGRRTSEHIFIDVKYVPKLPSVSVSPSGEIMEGSSVTLTCSSDANPAANYTWYKEKQALLQGPEGIYNFTSISSEDRGIYYCKSENQYGQINSSAVFIDVHYGPKTSNVSVSPSGEIVEGSSVTLTCSSDANPAANYTWYKENQTLLQGPGGIYNFTSISSEDTGIYHCTAENQYRQVNSSSLHIDVQYAPRLPSVSVSPSGEIMEGSSVNLTCSSDANPAANYTWYKENEDSPKASGQLFTIIDSRAEHSGDYYCEAQNKRGSHKSTLRLTVAASARTSAAVGTITAVFLVIVLIALFLWMRRKRSLTQQLNEGERDNQRVQLNMGPAYDLPSAAAQRQPAEQQDGLHYASISFSQNHTEAVYSNVRPARSHRPIEEEDEDDDVDYTNVKIDNASCATGARSQDDDGGESFALYSTVNKGNVNTT